jgi:hypothetical protein
VFKNQVARPYLEAELHMVWGEGVRPQVTRCWTVLVADGKVIARRRQLVRDARPGAALSSTCTGPTPNGKKMLFETGPEGEEERDGARAGRRPRDASDGEALKVSRGEAGRAAT